MSDSTIGTGAPTAPELSGDELTRKTLRTVALLVGAWVLFIGTLSLVAVLVTSKAVSQGGGAADGAARTETNAKKPLSI